MKIELLLRTLKAKSKPKKCKLRFTIGEDIQIQSAQQVPVEGVYPFLQKNTVEAKEQSLDYMSIQLISERKIIANKTLFVAEALNMKGVAFNCLQNKEEYFLNFELTITSIESSSDSQLIQMVRRTSIEDEPPNLSLEQSKLKVLKMGVLMYNFCQRIDPIISFHHKVVSLAEWEKPQETFGLGFFLTILVIYPKITISLLCLALLFGKQKIYKKFQEYQAKEDISKRLLFPQENLVFLQNKMQSYCDAFEVVNNFIREDDRAGIVSMVGIGCKFGAFLLLLQLFFSLQNLVIIAIWISLLIMSPMRGKLFKFVKPRVLQINSMIDNFTKTVSASSVGWAFRVSEIKTYEIIKQFYIYQYQRWWVGKHWMSSHWSDQNRELILLARTEPPKGWDWLENWTVDSSSQNADENGFEYSNDLLKTYTNSKSLKTIRRRKWYRRCNFTTPFHSNPHQYLPQQVENRSSGFSSKPRSSTLTQQKEKKP